MLSGIYWIIAAGLAGLYGLRMLNGAPNLTRTMVKALSIGMLAVVTLMANGPLILFLALIFSAIGDAFLAMDSKDTAKRPFLPAGMGAFFIAQLLYILLFLNGGGGAGLDVMRLILQGMLIAGAAAITAWIWPGLGDLKWPVVAYMGAVTMMALTAVGLPAPLALASLGAVMFLVSDAVLAGELFRLPPDHPARCWTPYAVWGLYWGGQALITAAFLSRPG
jgi:uncharacterized membrane protein YhhN